MVTRDALHYNRVLDVALDENLAHTRKDDGPRTRPSSAVFARHDAFLVIWFYSQFLRTPYGPLTTGIRWPSAQCCDNGPIDKEWPISATGARAMRTIITLSSLGLALALGGAALAGPVNRSAMLEHARHANEQMQNHYSSKRYSSHGYHPPDRLRDRIYRYNLNRSDRRGGLQDRRAPALGTPRGAPAYGPARTRGVARAHSPAASSNFIGRSLGEAGMHLQ
jgi:hypothetical protein